MRQLNIDWRIAKSSRINASRHQTMAERHSLTEQIKASVRARILEVVQDQWKYV